jgi:hypothetical protein
VDGIRVGALIGLVEWFVGSSVGDKFGRAVGLIDDFGAPLWTDGSTVGLSDGLRVGNSDQIPLQLLRKDFFFDDFFKLVVFVLVPSQYDLGLNDFLTDFKTGAFDDFEVTGLFTGSIVRPDVGLCVDIFEVASDFFIVPSLFIDFEPDICVSVENVDNLCTTIDCASLSKRADTVLHRQNHNREQINFAIFIGDSISK